MKKQSWILVTAVTAMLAATCAYAQDTSTTTTQTTTGTSTTTPSTTGTTTTGTTTTGTTTTGTTGTGTAGMPMGGPIDFTVLNNHFYDYMDLTAAKGRGYSESQVATIAKIARLSGQPFRMVLQDVELGKTFAVLADKYNLGLADVLDASDEKTAVENYITAYEATGRGALKTSMMGGEPMMGSTGTGAMGTTTGTTTTGTTTGTGTPDMTGTSTTAAPSTTPMAPTKDIVETAMSNKNFRTLVKALKAAGLVDTLKGTGPFTVFAPTDAAFKKLPKNALKNLMKNPDQLASVLKYHVIPAKIDAATAMAMTSPTSPATLEGSTLQVTTSDGAVMINGTAKVIMADVMATNGVIHAIDTVLMPSDMSTTGTAGATGTGTTGTGTTTTPAPAGGTTTTTPTP